MARPYSTKQPIAVPEEFEAFFVEHGWRRSELAFGVKPTKRYATILGIERLSAARRSKLGHSNPERTK